MKRERCRVTGARCVDCKSILTRAAVLGLLTAGLACLSIGCGSSQPVVPMPDDAEMDGLQFTRMQQEHEPFESSGDWLVK